MCENCNNNKEYSIENLGQDFEFEFNHDADCIEDAVGISIEQIQDTWGAVGTIFMSTESPSRFLEQLYKSKITRSELIICLQQAIARWE